MARTEVKSHQIKDGEVKRQDMNTADTGDAVITKVIAGSNINISSTGVDAGTGDVTVNSTTGVQSNDSFLKWRNVGDSADINVLKIDSNDDTFLNADSGNNLNLQINGSTKWYLDPNGNLLSGSSRNIDIGNSSSPNLVGDIYAEKLLGVNSNLEIGTTSGHDVVFSPYGSTKWTMKADGDFLPSTDSSYDIASDTVRVANVYADAFPAFTGIHLYKASSTVPSEGDAVYLNSSNELVSCSSAEDAKCIGIMTSKYNETSASKTTVRDSFGNIYTRETDPVVEKRVYHVASVGDTKTNNLAGAKVCDDGGSVSDGDLLCTSTNTGFLKKQSDNIIRSYTVAQARRNVTFDGNGEATGVYVYLLK